MKKSYWYIAGAIFITYLIMGTNKAFGKVTDDNTKRGCDPQGCGYFGARRTHGTHKGIDIVTLPNQLIKSPISGEITRYPFPDGSDLSKTGIEIINDTYKVKIFYVTPIISIGKKVSIGQTIATAQNITTKYGAGMTNHAHVEVYKKQGTNWALIDPTNLF